MSEPMLGAEQVAVIAAYFKQGEFYLPGAAHVYGTLLLADNARWRALVSSSLGPLQALLQFVAEDAQILKAAAGDDSIVCRFATRHHLARQAEQWIAQAQAALDGSA
jgi:hypothetical protein